MFIDAWGDKELLERQTFIEKKKYKSPSQEIPPLKMWFFGNSWYVMSKFWKNKYIVLHKLVLKTLF